MLSLVATQTETRAGLFNRDGVNAVAGTSEDVQSERPKANNGTLVSGKLH